MTRIDFYVLGDNSRVNRFSLACRIAEKAWKQGRRVLVHTHSQEEAVHMDKLLWTDKDQSFIPHGIASNVDSKQNPILISHRDDPCNEEDVLINLANKLPTFFSRFHRVAECIDTDPAVIQSSREHYRFYKARGYPLETHNLHL